MTGSDPETAYLGSSSGNPPRGRGALPAQGPRSSGRARPEPGAWPTPVESSFRQAPTLRAIGIGLLGACLFPAGQAAAADAPPPNIIFLFADDLGWGDLSCYGNRRVQTPALDRLARQGTLFTQFYVAGSVCSPSRAGMMTGQAPARNRIFGHLSKPEINARRGMPNELDPNAVTLPDLLREAGYSTAHFGKWHLGGVAPDQYGIDVFRTEQANNTARNSRADIWSPEARPTCTADILDDTLAFIRNHRDGPFYVNAWFSDVHATLNPSPEQLARTKKFQPGSVDFYGVEQVYYAALLEMDRQIGRFVEAVDALGIKERTLIIFSSDNGPEDYQIGNSAHSGVGSPGPFRGRKRSIYEGGIRVPFLLRWPGRVPADRVNHTSVVSALDFLPTLCALAGVHLPDGLPTDGEDMHDVWLGADRARTRPLFWEWRYRLFGHVSNHPPRLAVRDGSYKLLLNPDESRVELYDLDRDPGERDNIADTVPDQVARLRSLLLDWHQTLPESPVESAAGKATWPWPGR